MLGTRSRSSLRTGTTTSTCRTFMALRFAYHAPPRLKQCYVRAMSEIRAHPDDATLISVTAVPIITVFDSMTIISRNVLRVNESFASMFDKAEDGIQDLFPERAVVRDLRTGFPRPRAGQGPHPEPWRARRVPVRRISVRRRVRVRWARARHRGHRG